MANASNNSPFALGLDIGARSVGWSIIELAAGQPSGIRAAGVRCFDAGVEGNIEEGRDEAPGQKRRQAKSARRLNDRRIRRRRKLLRLLIAENLLPPIDGFEAAAIHRYFLALDQELRPLYGGESDREQQTWLYRLRAKGLDGPLPAYHLGRALYQLSQRRGFLSNRKAKRKDDDESQVQGAITELESSMREQGARTLGEYLSRLDPHECRIRRRWTARSMFEHELSLLWQHQAPFHLQLTDDLLRKVRLALFYQRPLKSQKGRVGRCEIFSSRKRAPLACREAQEFRLAQTVNNLRVTVPGEKAHELSPEQRDQLLQALREKGDLTFKRVRKLLALPEEAEINLERMGEKKLIGHRTDEKLCAVFRERWQAWSDEEKNQIVDIVLSVDDEAALARKAASEWGLSLAAAAELSQIRFEPGYVAFSRKALRQLLPALASGENIEVARRRLFPRPERAPVEALARVEEALPALRNPAVFRALTELRKVVNAIVRRWGRPELVRIELGRDLRNSRERRRRLAKQNRQRQDERDVARAEIRRTTGLADPSRTDIEKYQLAKECRWECPYTGRKISPSELFGPNPQFDIEHIWPLSRSLDNSFLNKTLCWHEENRNRKQNRTPWEAYASDLNLFGLILDRVGKFDSQVRLTKLERFNAAEIPSDFAERQLNDTRFATRLAMQYLGQLFGGTVDAAGRRRVHAGAGGLTAIVRNELGLNAILGDGGQKSRDDHRHHAVDAIAIALTDDAMVQRLQRAAAEAPAQGRRAFARIEESWPWEGFLAEARELVRGIAVSHRPRRKVSGALHEETNYSPAIAVRDVAGQAREVRRVRKPVHLLSPGEVARIADPAVKRAVEARIAEHAGDRKRLEAEPARLPHGNRRTVAVRKARIEVSEKPRTVGPPGEERYVVTGSNHHLAVVARLNERGEEVAWEGHIVSMLDAQLRLRAGEPVVQRNFGLGRRFRFSLSPGDTVEMRNKAGQVQLFRVDSVWPANQSSRMRITRISDARDYSTKRKSGEVFQPWLNVVFKSSCRKVEVSPLGEVFERRD